MILNCVTIDDEPLARECITNYIREIDFLKLVGTGSNPLELSKIQQEHTVDVLFMDIQMPRMNGIEFLKVAVKRPMVVLTTAYPHYALEGFELDVSDYLLKPITFSRFFKAAIKVKEQYQLAHPIQRASSSVTTTKGQDHIFIKCDHTYQKIFLDDILYVAAMQNYVTFHTTDGKKHHTLLPLKQVVEKFPVDQFMQVHKSYIVAVSKITAIHKEKIEIGSQQIPVSRNYRSLVLDTILKDKLWKK